MHDDQVDVTTEIVATLLQEQFPQWSGKAIQVLSSTGTVHAIFRIGNDLSARFPLRLADAAEALAVLEQEARASAELAQVSRFPAPEPVALGKPGAGCPMPWSVQTWVPGTVAFDADPGGSDAFAEDLAAFIADLRGVKRGEHRRPPRPDRSPAEAVAIAPHWRTAPINPPTKVPRSWDPIPSRANCRAARRTRLCRSQDSRPRPSPAPAAGGG